MSNDRHPEPQRVALAQFLAGLGREDAGRAQAAAETIDDLEARANPVRGIERRLAPIFYASSIAFVLGMILFFFGRDSLFGLFGWVDNLGITMLLGALPVLGFYYAFRVRSRTRADSHSFELNQKYFLPHGGIYFAAAGPGENACVVLVDPEQGWRPVPSKYDKLKPGPIW